MASFTQIRNLCAVAATAVLVAGGCGKDKDAASNGGDGDLSNLKAPDAHTLRVDAPDSQPDFAAANPSSVVSETPRVVEKFKSITELFAALKKECAEADMSATLIPGSTNKVVIVHLETHSQDGDDDSIGRIQKTQFLNDRWGLNAFLCEGYLGKGGHSPEQQQIIAQRDKILSADANGGSDALVSVPDPVLEALPKGVEFWGIESTNSMRLAAIANIVAEGWAQLEESAQAVLSGQAKSVVVGKQILQQMQAAQNNLGESLPANELPPAVPSADGTSAGIAITSANASEIKHASEQYAQWHMEHLVNQRNNDLRDALTRIVPRLGDNVHAFLDMGAIHGADLSGTNANNVDMQFSNAALLNTNAVLRPFVDNGYTVIVTQEQKSQ